MTPDRWRQIETIFQRAIERDRRDRPAFLDEACADDASLRIEVEALIRAGETGASLLESPAAEAYAELLSASAGPTLSGSAIGPYRLMGILGTGGMGRVYLAEDTRLGRKVALKLLPPGLAGDVQLRSRLVREARLAAALDHPNVCTIYEVGEDGPHCFIAMQYVTGQTLKQSIGGRPLAIETMLPLILQVADGLSAAHALGIIHRDIKPANIVVTPGGQAKVLDFGLAKALDDRDSDVTRTIGVAGTPAYMSPEQARGSHLDHRTDIFSLGAVLYEMATGRPPFRGESVRETLQAVVERPQVPARQLNPDVPPGLSEVIDRALAKDPRDRYQSIDDVIAGLRRLQAPPPAPHRVDKWALVAAMVLLLAGGAWWLGKIAAAAWARRQIPRIEALAREQRVFEAYDLGVRLRSYIPADPELARVLPPVSDRISVATEPPAARVYLKRIEGSRAPARELLGGTPIRDREIARGDYVLTIEKDGYAALERTISGVPATETTAFIASRPIRLDVTLTPAGRIPAGMVRVPGGDYRLMAWARPTDARIRLQDYFIDKYEVGNREYREFVRAGGYLKQEYWRYPFKKNGRPVAWEEAMKELKDRTGLPGPRGWSEQTYPEGNADHPVTGVTWHEAAAYAAFRGKRLPTIFEWEKAARNGISTPYGLTMPWGLARPGDELRANFGEKGTAPVAAFESGMSPFGCYNMAGNVAEWCFNETSRGFITAGGSWGEPEYIFGDYGIFPPLHSSDRLGFRCAWTGPGAAGDQGAMWIRLEDEVPQYTALPVPAAWRQRYDYQRTPLEARVVEVKETEGWRREKITYVGGGGERAIAYLYLPNNFPRPLELVHVVPGGDVSHGIRSLPSSIEATLAALIRSGRAVFSVVLAGYPERERSPFGNVSSAASVEFAEAAAQWVVDLRRGLDYVTTRPEIDVGRIAFYMASAGGIPLIAPALEDRYRSVFLWGTGIERGQAAWRPEANPIHFLPLIRAPKLVLQGRYDEDNPLKTYAEPFFRLLREPKRIKIFDGGHRPSPQILFPVLHAWLDETLGPVRLK